MNSGTFVILTWDDQNLNVLESWLKRRNGINFFFLCQPGMMYLNAGASLIFPAIIGGLVGESDENYVLH